MCFVESLFLDIKFAQLVQILNDRYSKQESRLDFYNFDVKLDHRVFNPVFVGLLYVLVKNFPLFYRTFTSKKCSILSISGSYENFIFP